MCSYEWLSFTFSMIIEIINGYIDCNVLPANISLGRYM